MQAGPGYLAPVDLHGVKHGHRGDLAGAGCVPFDVLELAFIGVILELEGHPVLIVVIRLAAGPGISRLFSQINIQVPEEGVSKLE